MNGQNPHLESAVGSDRIPMPIMVAIMRKYVLKAMKTVESILVEYYEKWLSWRTKQQVVENQTRGREM